MTSSGDHPSYEKEFSGDDTGQIFDVPDMIPTVRTGRIERIVDTQSGFIVNLKNVDGRIALSVKRRVGTPPGSTILFTPDESLKLSKILASSSTSDEHGILTSYYATDVTRHRGNNLLKTLRSSEKLGSLWVITLLVSGAIIGYFVRFLLDIHH